MGDQETNRQHRLDRRSFLQGGALFAAGTLGASLLGGCAPTTTEAERSDPPRPNEADYVLSNADPIPPIEGPVAWDEEFDVVVAGSGGGGMGSTMYLSQAGKKVLLVEKGTHFGGATASAGAFTCPGGTKVQNDMGMPYDVDEILDSYCGSQHYAASGFQRAHIRNLIVKGPQFLDWFMEQGAPMFFVPTIPCFVSVSQEGGSGAVSATNFALAKCQEAGADLRLQTECIGLIRENGRIAGMRIRDNVTGEEKNVAGSDGVVMATGGFCNNRDLLQKYCPTVYETVATTCAPLSDTGDGTRMLLGLGAVMVDFDSFRTFDGGLDAGTWAHTLNSQDTQLARQPWLGIDVTGRRYPYEYTDPVNVYKCFQKQAAVLQALPDHWGYIFFDDAWPTKARVFGQEGCRSCGGIEDIPAANVNPVNPCSFDDGAQIAFDRGVFKTADTIEDVALQLGINPDLAVRAVEEWNEMCEKGVDEEFGLPADWLLPIDTPPYHGARVGSTLLATHAGLRVDTQARVLDSAGKPIEGLYGVSTLVGGFSGCSNFGLASASPLGTLCYSWTSGYIAGQSIMGELEA